MILPYCGRSTRGLWPGSVRLCLGGALSVGRQGMDDACSCCPSRKPHPAREWREWAGLAFGQDVSNRVLSESRPLDA